MRSLTVCHRTSIERHAGVLLLLVNGVRSHAPTCLGQWQVPKYWHWRPRMERPRNDALSAMTPLPEGYCCEKLRRSDIPALIAAIAQWHPDISVGAASGRSSQKGPWPQQHLLRDRARNPGRGGRQGEPPWGKRFGALQPRIRRGPFNIRCSILRPARLSSRPRTTRRWPMISSVASAHTASSSMVRARRGSPNRSRYAAAMRHKPSFQRTLFEYRQALAAT